MYPKNPKSGFHPLCCVPAINNNFVHNSKYGVNPMREFAIVCAIKTIPGCVVCALAATLLRISGIIAGLGYNTGLYIVNDTRTSIASQHGNSR